MKKPSKCFLLLALLLSHAMVAVVAWSYRSMICCIQHAMCSAPAWVAFLYAIPFGIGIVLCLSLALFYRKKGR